MIFVNDPGSDRGWRQLQHAPWNGFTLADIVFPAFVFVMGTALALSSKRPTFGRILRRSLALVAIGVVLNWANPLTGGPLRYPGVLQRIGLAYLVVALLVGRLPLVAQAVVAVALLGGYGWALLHVSVPGAGAGVVTPVGNLAGYVDRTVFGQAHLYRHAPYDPEGLISTSGAVVTALFGAWAGLWVRRHRRSAITTLGLFAAGTAALGTGWWWGRSLAFNKRLWSPAYTLWSAGWILLVLAVLWEIIEVRGWRWLRQPWQVLGFNALVLYVVTELGDRLLRVTHVGRLTAHAWSYQRWFAPHWSTDVASVLWSVAFVAVFGGASWLLYRRGLSIRL
jgi:predicted acyltransferase